MPEIKSNWLWNAQQERFEMEAYPTPRKDYTSLFKDLEMNPKLKEFIETVLDDIAKQVVTWRRK
jgi:hypothetical protein